MIRSFRILQTKYLETAFNGEGARRYGGRWNSKGTRIIYTAGSLSLAILEILVHIEDYSIISGLYSAIPVEFDESLVQKLDPMKVPPGWDGPEPIAATQIVGDTWIKNSSSVLLEVPSAVVTLESNFLINPVHEDFEYVKIGEGNPLNIDERL